MGIQIISDLPIPKSMNISEDSRLECLSPFIEYLMRISETDIARVGTCYASDACFSILCGKLGPEWRQLFPVNRNLVHPGSHGIQQINQREEIAVKLKEVFPTGLKISGLVMRAKVVSELFYAVNLFGTLMADGKILEMMRALVVVGREGKLMIANDILSLRYPERTQKH